MNNQTMLATVATTVATLHLMSFQPVKNTTPTDMAIIETCNSDGFEPQFRVINGKMFSLTDPLISSIEATNNLLEIGDILFKDARDISSAESAFMHSFVQTKYKKLTI